MQTALSHFPADELLKPLGILDLTGLAGVVAFVAAYFLVQVLHHPPGSRTTTLLNIAGSVCMLVSLTGAFNLASFVSQCFWLGITLLGWWRRRRTPSNA